MFVPVQPPDAWDTEYKTRGQRWGGAPPDIPPLLSGARVLELGCGDGKTLAAAVTRPWILTALDFSGEAIRLCSRRVTASTVRFVIADAACLPFRENAFDAVLMFHVAGHALAPERHTIINEAMRVLCPGGVVFFREFSRLDMRAGTGDETEPHTYRRGDGTTTHYFDRDETVSLFSPMIEASFHVHTWSMRIRGRDFPRSEIQAEFRKKEK